jgi:hypothetical protein
VAACSKCGTVNPVVANFCRSCGNAFRKHLFMKVGAVALSWCTITPFTSSLFSWSGSLLTIENRTIMMPAPAPAPAATPTPLPTPAVADPKETERDDVVTGNDIAGKGATFLISLLSDEYRWVIGSISELEPPHTRLEFSDEMKENINNAREVICVGASSEDIRPGATEEEGRREEEQRAERRAETIAIWVRQAKKEGKVRVRKLNVGHHMREGGRGTGGVETSHQRRVIIILVLEEDEGVNMDQALRDALEKERDKHPIYATMLDNYSLTRRGSFTWAP